MHIKFMNVGLGVCMATSPNEKIIYFLVGNGGRKVLFDEKNIISQNFLDIISEKCYEYRTSKSPGWENIEYIKF